MWWGAVGSSHSDRSRTTHSIRYCYRSRSIFRTLHIPKLLVLGLLDMCSSYPSRFHHHSSLNRGCSNHRNTLCTVQLLWFHSTDTCSHDTNSHNSRNHGYSIVLLHCNIVLLFLLLFCSSHSDRSRTTHSSQYCHHSHSILLTLHIPELGLLLEVAMLLLVDSSSYPNRLLQTHSSPNRGCNMYNLLDNTIVSFFHLLHECLIHK